MFRDIGTSQPQRWESQAGEEHSKQAQFISTETPHEILSKRWGKSKRCAWEIHKTQSIGLLNLEIIVLWQITPVFVSSLLDIFELMCKEAFANKMKEASVFDKKYYCNMKIGHQFSENAAIGLSFYLHGHGRLLSPSGDLGIGLVWDNNRTGPDHISLRLLKSSSNWTKSSMMGPQLFLGWYQMILDVGSD